MPHHDNRTPLSELRRDIGAAVAVLTVVAFGTLIVMQLIDLFYK